MVFAEGATIGDGIVAIAVSAMIVGLAWVLTRF